MKTVKAFILIEVQHEGGGSPKGWGWKASAEEFVINHKSLRDKMGFHNSEFKMVAAYDAETGEKVFDGKTS